MTDPTQHSLPEQVAVNRQTLLEFDAWLSVRGEFGEVLTAFRDAFKTDTRDAEYPSVGLPASLPMPSSGSLPEVPDEAFEAAARRWREDAQPHAVGDGLPIDLRFRNALTAALPSLHAAWEKERAEQFGPVIEDWVGPDGETYSSLKQRERAMLDSACINQKRREEVEASPGVLSKEEARLVADLLRNRVGTMGTEELQQRLSKWAGQA